VELFSRSPRLFAAPGRVNLIGDHTDYNDGWVLPMAIDLRTIVAVAPRNDSLLRVHSMNMEERAEIDLATPPRGPRSWVAYVEGVARVLQSCGHFDGGADLVIGSDVPVGAGLSSSAALEIAVGLALLGVSGRSLPPTELALAAQRAEHEYVGTLCGIMDQLVVALGRAGHALLIDCRSLEATRVPLDLAGAAVVVCDTGVKHELAASAYNQRRAECEKAAEFVGRTKGGVRTLRDVREEELARAASTLPEVLHRRARHVVTENARTLAAADALREGRLEAVGRLMFASHASLRDDYEVSAPELDTLVAAAEGMEGVYGARMTGGGFGGCVVSLVAAEAVPSVTRRLVERFDREHRRPLRCFVTQASGGGLELVEGESL
jgi:galactokinase